MFREIRLTWSEFKSWATARSKSIQWIDRNTFYHLIAFDGNLSPECFILKSDPAGADQSDFETNYKNIGNKVIDPKDADSSSILRPKVTRTGWHFEPRCIEFTTAKMASLHNRKADGFALDAGTTYTDAALKFYNNAGAQLVQGGGESDADFQTRLDQNCTCTIMDWQPQYDMEIIRGCAAVETSPSTPVRGWVVAAPDIPEQYGGSVPFMVGLNLQFMASKIFVFFDGEAAKFIAYDPVYNTNKFRFKLVHGLAIKTPILIIFDHYKA